MTRRILLYGGGLDSTALIFHLVNEYEHPNLTLLHIDYGQKALSGERRAFDYFAHKYSLEQMTLTVDMSYSGAHIMKDVRGIASERRHNVLELRNPVLLSMAASYAASISSPEDETEIYVGFHQEPENTAFLDAKVAYLRTLEQALNCATNRKIKLRAPFAAMSRQHILGVAVVRDREILTRSYTCYEAEPCGECFHCVEKATMQRKYEGIEL